MLNFIELTSAINDEKVYVNPNKICTFYKVDYDKANLDDETIVQFSEQYNYLKVKETPEEIKKMISIVS